MTTSESKGRFFCTTNRLESIRITNRIESIQVANWNALLCITVQTAKHLTVESYMVIYAPNSYTY